MIKYVLFDFDGTLVDSKTVFITVFNELAVKYNFQRIEQTNIEQLRELSMVGRLKLLSVPFYKLPFLTKEFLSSYKLQIGSIPFMPGMSELLSELDSFGINTGIISSNSVNTVNAFLQNKKVYTISEVHCSGRIFGKERMIQSFLRRKSVQRSEVLYVCDELRDIEACHKAQIRSIWVSWGFETRKAINTGLIDFSADTPEQLLEIILNEYKQPITRASTVENDTKKLKQ